MNVRKLLMPAVRQYRHNFGSEELVCGYDEKETEKIVHDLLFKISRLSFDGYYDHINAPICCEDIHNIIESND